MTVSKQSIRRSLFAVVGLAAVLSGCAMMRHSDKDGDDDEKEVKTSFATLPAAVQQTFTAESGGATIATVDAEPGKDGKTTYEADVMMKGTNYEIKVAADGTLISKKIDKEEDEKDEKGEKAEK